MLKSPSYFSISPLKIKREGGERSPLILTRNSSLEPLLNCSSKSSPKLWNRAYTGKNIDAELEKRTKLNINDINQIIITKRKVILTQIFEWYKDDFNNGDILSFIGKYTDQEISKNAKITYTPYNWELSKKEIKYVGD